MELISIITPVYNAEKYIEKTIAGVQAQTYTNWELLLTEDCSTDKTVSVLTKYLKEHPDVRIRLLRMNQNSGAARARNRALLEARGRYIAYLDADDVWKPQKLERQLEFMQKKAAAFCFTNYEFGDEYGNGTGKIVQVPLQLTYKKALKNTTIFTSTVMFDTAIIAKPLLTMPVMKSEDTALWWKVLRNGYVADGLQENLVLYTRPSNSLSSNKVEAIRRIYLLYRRAEGMGILKSIWHMGFWAFNAVRRRV